MQKRFLVAVLLLGMATAAGADAPGVYALTNGVVHPVSGPPIANGVVLIREGLIEAVGAGIPLPPDATVIDVKGAHIYPGLFDAHTTLGFAAPASTSPRERAPEPTPDFTAAQNIKLTVADLDSRRRSGVTTVVAAPAYGIFNGMSAVVNLTDAEGTRVIRTPAALQISFNRRPTWTYPDSLMGVVAYLRQTFLDAQQHQQARSIYDRSPAGLRRPETSVMLESLWPVLRRDVPVVFVADSEEMIDRARALAQEFSLRPMIAGARGAYAAAERLRETPVLVSVRWPTAPSRREDREEQPLRVIRDRALAPTTPAALARAGVPFALVSGTAPAADYLRGIRKAISSGLSPDDALRAVTLTPARIFGVDRQLGTLERGKIANVIVADRPIFERRARVTRIFVDGRQIRVEPRESAATDESPVNGSWSLTVRTPQQNIAINIILRAERGYVSGTFSGDRGSGEISGGFYSAPTLQFTISAEVDGETSDWLFRGTVRDDSVEGTVSTNIGTFPFSGSKSE